MKSVVLAKILPLHVHILIVSCGFLLGFDFLLAAIYGASFQDHSTFSPFSTHKTLQLLGEHSPACCTLSVTSAPPEELRTPQDKWMRLKSALILQNNNMVPWGREISVPFNKCAYLDVNCIRWPLGSYENLCYLGIWNCQRPSAKWVSPPLFILSYLYHPAPSSVLHWSVACTPFSTVWQKKFTPF